MIKILKRYLVARKIKKEIRKGISSFRYWFEEDETRFSTGTKGTKRIRVDAFLECAFENSWYRIPAEFTYIEMHGSRKNKPKEYEKFINKFESNIPAKAHINRIVDLIYKNRFDVAHDQKKLFDECVEKVLTEQF